MMFHKKDAVIVLLDEEPGRLCRLPYPNYTKGFQRLNEEENYG